MQSCQQQMNARGCFSEARCKGRRPSAQGAYLRPLQLLHAVAQDVQSATAPARRAAWLLKQAQRHIRTCSQPCP